MGLLLLVASYSVQLAQDAEDVVRVRTDLVTIPLRIESRNGKPRPPLSVEDFSIFVDGRALPVADFSQQPRDLRLLILVDESGSVIDNFPSISKSARLLAERLGKNSELAIATFNTQITSFSGFYRNSADLRWLDNLKPESNRKTAIFDSVMKSIDYFSYLPKQRSELAAIVIVSDGIDSSSKSSWRRLLEAAHAGQIVIYSLQIASLWPSDGRLVPRPASRGYREIAEKSGGKFFLTGPKSLSDTTAKVDLEPLFGAVERDLKAQSLISFYPPDYLRDGARHSITVKLSTSKKENLIIRQDVNEVSLGK